MGEPHDLPRLGSRAVRRLLAFGLRCAERAVELQFVDRAVAIASLAFTALVPMMVIVAAFLPGTRGLADTLVRRFHLHDGSAELVRQVFAQPDATRQALSWIGVALLVASALSLTRALQRVYERAWRLPALGVRGSPAGLTWLAGILVWITLFTSLRRWIIGVSSPEVALVVALAGNFELWLFTPYVLLSRRVGWRRLVPTAALTAVAMSAASAVSVVYMPTAIDDSAARYGPIGIAIALVSWLVTLGFVLVLCAAVGAVIGDGAPSDPAPPGESVPLRRW